MPELIRFDGIEGEGKITGIEGLDRYQQLVLRGEPSDLRRAGRWLFGGQGAFRISNIANCADKASATLLKNMTFGTHFPTVEIVSLKTTGETIEKYLHFELEKVLVTSVQQSGGGSGVPMKWSRCPTRW